MKTLAAILSFGCLFLVSASLSVKAGTLRTNVTLVWNYPTTSYTVTNGTETVTFTNAPDVFKVYSTTNIALNTTNWPLLTTVSGTVTSVTVPVTHQMQFFIVNASNIWGEFVFTEVAWMPPVTSDKGKLELY